MKNEIEPTKQPLPVAPVSGCKKAVRNIFTIYKLLLRLILIGCWIFAPVFLVRITGNFKCYLLFVVTVPVFIGIVLAWVEEVPHFPARPKRGD